MHEEEIENLTTDLCEKNNELNQCITEFEHEISLKS